MKYTSRCKNCQKKYHSYNFKSKLCKKCNPKSHRNLTTKQKNIRGLTSRWVASPLPYKTRLRRLWVLNLCDGLDAIDRLEVAHLWMLITDDAEIYSVFKIQHQVKKMIDILYHSLGCYNEKLDEI